MAAKLSVAATVAVSFLLLLIPASLFFFFSSSSLPARLLSFSPCLSVPSASDRPLKVYMYDLPSRFNLAMLSASDSHLSFPPWPDGSGVKRQHSVEYWMMASLFPQPREISRGEKTGADNGIRVVRVLNGDDADVFFVPFFSSLSFNVHGHNMTDPDTEIDRQLQVDLLEILGNSKFYQRSAGRDHVVPMHHPNAFRFYRDLLNSSMLVVSDFARLPMDVSYLRKDIVAPYVHVVDSFLDDDPSDPYGSRPTLLFFRGRTVRKAEGIVRAKLAKMMKGFDDVHFEDSFATGEGIKASTEGMRKSKFCLSPAGDTPSSCRLFDAIISHCVPIIISDRIELPFEDEIDYTEFSLFFSVKEALTPSYLLGQLRNFPRERWLEMWGRLKNVSHHFEFNYPAQKGDAVDLIWQQVRRKLPDVNLSMHRSRRLKIPDWWR
ncbi:Exostosin-like [Rhynchospora pubera]|uniref:Exostosin-like n=1 Tax=Rhynchospora pubera TaxID=906938 RepID=A0AAV8H4E2_9POAL|nr:Exostosin-like [Rhynchospora pubera]